MTGKVITKFIKKTKQAVENAKAEIEKTKLTDSERISDLESVVASLSGSLSKEGVKDMAKVYSNMVLLENIAIEDVPSDIKEEVGSLLTQKGKGKEMRKEDTP